MPILFPIPLDYLQNYPNPFNPATTISNSIPAGYSDFVSLKVYDVRGAFIATLVDNIGSPGIFSVLWDGKDNWGNIVSCGVYIYRLQINDFSKSYKIVKMSEFFLIKGHTASFS